MKYLTPALALSIFFLALVASSAVLAACEVDAKIRTLRKKP